MVYLIFSSCRRHAIPQLLYLFAVNLFERVTAASITACAAPFDLILSSATNFAQAANQVTLASKSCGIVHTCDKDEKWRDRNDNAITRVAALCAHSIALFQSSLTTSAYVERCHSAAYAIYTIETAILPIDGGACRLVHDDDAGSRSRRLFTQLSLSGGRRLRWWWLRDALLLQCQSLLRQALHSALYQHA